MELKKKLNINIQGITLEIVESYKYLGVLLDEKLTFAEHINYIINIIARKNYLLCKIRPCLNQKIALLLFKTCILPYVDIGDIFYNSGYKTLLNKLQTLQNKSLKIVYGKDTELSTDEMHAKSNLLKLESRRKVNLLKTAYKMKEESFLRSEPIMPDVNTLMSLRSQNQCRLRVDLSKNSKHEHSFSVRSIRLWNALPADLKKADNVKSFCVRVKKEMLQSKLNFPE